MDRVPAVSAGVLPRRGLAKSASVGRPTGGVAAVERVELCSQTVHGWRRPSTAGLAPCGVSNRSAGPPEPDPDKDTIGWLLPGPPRRADVARNPSNAASSTGFCSTGAAANL